MAGTVWAGAIDADILGVDADCRIHIRRDVLEEHDGPMLRHGLQEMGRQPILLPAQRPQPNPLRPAANRSWVLRGSERYPAHPLDSSTARARRGE